MGDDTYLSELIGGKEDDLVYGDSLFQAVCVLIPVVIGILTIIVMFFLRG